MFVCLLNEQTIFACTCETVLKTLTVYRWKKMNVRVPRTSSTKETFLLTENTSVKMLWVSDQLCEYARDQLQEARGLQM